MRRYYFTESLELNQSVQLESELFHHIFEVCRMQVGQHFELISVDGRAALVQVESVGKKYALVKVKELRELPAPKEPRIHLVMAIPRYAVFEATLEKSVELGVSQIHLAYSEFSQVKTDGNFAFNKVPRWEKIVVGATQQTGRGDLMPILKPRPIFEIAQQVNQNPNSQGLFAYEGDGGVDIKSYLKALKNKKPKEIWIFAGSEGGFSKGEVSRFLELDLHPVTLGEQILRVETACVALVSALKYEFDLLR